MNEKVSHLKEALKHFLPNAEFHEYAYAKDQFTPPHFYYLTAPNSNLAYTKSKYFYKDSNNPIHFTGLEKLNSIIETKSLRLYNFNNMEDPLEYEFSGNLFPDQENYIEDAKENVFSISFCSDKLLDKKHDHDQFNLWRLYGHNGKGACITFSIENNPEEWRNHHMSKIQYAKVRLGKAHSGFGQLRVLLEKLNKNEPRISFDFAKLFCFHKSFLYSHEQEIRLIFDGRESRTGEGYTTYKKYEQILYPLITECETNGFGKKIKYISLPIDGTSPDLVQLPNLRINNITIGYGYSMKEFGKISKELKSLIKSNLNYMPSIKRSKLAVQYWGHNQ